MWFDNFVAKPNKNVSNVRHFDFMLILTFLLRNLYLFHPKSVTLSHGIDIRLSFAQLLLAWIRRQTNRLTGRSIMQ